MVKRMSLSGSHVLRWASCPTGIYDRLIVLVETWQIVVEQVWQAVVARVWVEGLGCQDMSDGLGGDQNPASCPIQPHPPWATRGEGASGQAIIGHY